MLRLFPFLLVCILFLQNCKELPIHPDLLELPPPTETGENTFGCFRNGEIWRDNGGYCVMCGPNPYAKRQNSVLSLGARNVYSEDSTTIIDEYIDFVLYDAFWLKDNTKYAFTDKVKVNYLDALSGLSISSAEENYTTKPDTTLGYIELSRYTQTGSVAK